MPEIINAVPRKIEETLTIKLNNPIKYSSKTDGQLDFEFEVRALSFNYRATIRNGKLTNHSDNSIHQFASDITVESGTALYLSPQNRYANRYRVGDEIKGLFLYSYAWNNVWPFLVASWRMRDNQLKQDFGLR